MRKRTRMRANGNAIADPAYYPIQTTKQFWTIKSNNLCPVCDAPKPPKGGWASVFTAKEMESCMRLCSECGYPLFKTELNIGLM